MHSWHPPCREPCLLLGPQPIYPWDATCYCGYPCFTERQERPESLMGTQERGWSQAWVSAAQQHSGVTGFPSLHGFCPKEVEFLAPCFPLPPLPPQSLAGKPWDPGQPEVVRGKLPFRRPWWADGLLNSLLLSLCSGGRVHWLVEQVLCLCRGEGKVWFLPGEGFWHPEGETTLQNASPSLVAVVSFRDEQWGVTGRPEMFSRVWV